MKKRGLNTVYRISLSWTQMGVKTAVELEEEQKELKQRILNKLV